MAESLYAPLADRALIAVAGDEAQTFLQGLVSNDVERVAPGRAIYAALLTPQGRYLYDFFIMEIAGTLHLDCEAARRDELLKRLALYKLRAKVSLDKADALAVFAAFGDNALKALGLDATPGRAHAIDGGIVYTDPRNSKAGARAALPPGEAKTELERAGFRAAQFADYDAMRVRLGLPDSSRDLIVDRALLLECGFEALNGIDFDKGCYVGQEVTTRMKRRALVKKLLLPVAINGDVPAPGTKIMRDGVEVGEMRSSQGDMGFALLRLDATEGELTAGEARISPRPRS